ncbi:MAG TPA: response regulator [Rhizomicrobium sp.]|nr:response regulator [Rhizomicrobium sp.]
MKLEPKFTSNAEPRAAGAAPLNIFVLLRSEADRAELEAALAGLKNISFEMKLRVSQVISSLLGGAQRPDVLLVDVDVSNDDDLALLRDLKEKARATKVPVIALIERSADFNALRAIRAGADDILLKPLDNADAQELFARVAGVHDRTPVLDTSLGGAITFLHVAGGAGATTLAVNAAVLLATKDRDGETCLLDLDIQYGNAASLLDLNSFSPIDGLIDDPSRLDREMLEGMMIKHASGLRVLTAPQLPFPLNAYSSEMIARIIKIAKLRFAHVVIDLPVALAQWTDIVLREAEFDYLVCAPSVASVHRVAQFLKLLDQEGLGNLPLKIMLNRGQSMSKGSDISTSQFEKAIGRTVDHVLPDDYPLISLSHAQGQAAVQLRPDSKFTAQLSNILAGDLRLDALVRKKSRWPFGNE